MKKLSTYFLFLLVHFNAFAQSITISGVDFNMQDLASVVTFNGATPDPKAMNIKQILTLEVNPLLFPKNATKPFDVTIEFTVRYGNVSLTNSENKTLHINYSLNGQFKSKDAFVIEKFKLVNYSVTSIMLNINGKKQALLDNNLVIIHQQLQYDLIKEPIITDKIQTQEITIPLHNGYASLNWQPIDWAIAYDIEYTYIDYYSLNSDLDINLPTKQCIFSNCFSPQIPYDFRNNATRVQVKSTNYEIPLVYEKGYLLYRVRPVGLGGNIKDKIVTGTWSVLDYGTELPSIMNPIPFPHSESGIGTYFAIIDSDLVHEQDKKNWQYIATFAEEGKRKDVVSYLDGTLRNRQNVTNLSTNRSILVGETIYDFNGRPVIETLPTPIVPIEPNGRIPIQYLQNVNVNSLGKPYSRNDFDTDKSCLPFPSPFNNTQGAGKYYSSNHNFSFNEEAYIPDAEGYPFIQKEFTPDNSGRIKRQSAAGKSHHLGDKSSGTHEQKYYYSTPAQDELDRLLGSDAGANSYYHKEIKIDENGQSYFSIKDLKGKVVASGLTGDSPENLDILDSKLNKEITVNVIEENNIITGNSIISYTTLVLTTPTQLSFSYAFDNNGVSFKNCDGTQDICYDCIYDLSISITDECGNKIWKKQEKIGTLTNLLTCENGNVHFVKDTTLEVGSYIISKNLTVNEDAVNEYVANYLSNATCWGELQSQLIPTIAAQNPNPCPVLPDCPPLASIDINPPPSAIAGVNLPPVKNLPAANQTLTNCKPDTISTSCAKSFQKMLADVSPGGQYGGFNDTLAITTFPLSVLNHINNALSTKGNWKKPVSPYKNPDGTDSKVSDSSGALVSPENLTDWKDFVKNWQPSWANSLVMYHPEICLYDWCVSHSKYSDYQQEIINAKTFNEAKTKHPDLFIAPNYNTPDSGDPLLADVKLYKQLQYYMGNILPAFLKPASGATPTGKKALYELAATSAAGFSKKVTNTLTDQYLISHTFYSDPLLQDEEWSQFKNYYLMARTKIIDSLRYSDLHIKANCFIDTDTLIGDSTCINNPHCPYKDKTPVFPTQKQVNDVSKNGANKAGATVSGLSPDDQSDACGNCSDAQRIMIYLNQLIAEHKLIGDFQIRGPLVAMIANTNTDSFLALGDHFSWNGTTTPNQLMGKINSQKNGNLCQISLNLNTGSATPTLDWNKIIGLSCLGTTTTDDTKFTLKGYDDSGKIFDFVGNTTCMKMKNCSDKIKNTKICTPQPYLFDFVVMLDKTLKSIVKTPTGYEIPKQTLHNGLATTNYLFNLRPTVIWSINKTEISNSSNFDIRLIIDEPSCNFALKSNSDILVNLKQIIGYDLMPNNERTDSCSLSTNLLVWAIDNFGKTQSFEVHITDKYCFSLGTCCPQPPNNFMCCVPILPKIPTVPAPTCQEIADIQNKNNADIIVSQKKHQLTDDLRQQYIYHCLRPVENYTLKYNQSVYQVTLSYYDQAGNLTKTVPPKGIKYLSDAQMAQVKQARANGTTGYIPNHTFATTYEYNTLNAVVKTKSPDAGTTRFCYDELGRIIMSQNEEQTKPTDINKKTVSFTNYDELGRVIQSGELFYYATLPTKMKFADFQQYQIGKNDFGGGIYRNKKDVVSIFYDRLPTTIAGGFDINLAKLNQKNLRNRVAATLYYRESGSIEKKYTHANFYSYDIHGNVAVLKQDFRHLANYSDALNLGDSLNFHRLKTISYDYDLISGKVNQVWYQPNQADQFIHRYEYDADNRIVSVKTTTRPWEDTRTIDEDARYKYYLHGPLARIELGREKVQGIDYAYTINGWIKGVNSSELDPTKDMGKDNGTTVAKDAFAYSLSYFPEDYKAVSTKTFVPALEGTPLTTGFSKPLFNGNIRYMITAIDAFTGADKIQATAYSYDALNRIKAMQTYRANDASNKFWLSGGFSDAYKCSYSYDANGNILSLNRNNDKYIGEKMDELSYSYATTNNQLLRVNDNAGRKNSVDLDSKNAYSYDAKGRLSTEQESPTTPTNLQYTWASFDKLRNVNKNGIDIAFEYDAAMHRAFKYDNKNNIATYYVNDQQGNPMAIYTFTPDSSHLSEVPLYGSKRLGVWNAHLNLRQTQAQNQLSYSRATKQYELSNHLGNVLTTISDRRITKDSTTWLADIQTAQDYYPFGSVMPKREFNNEKFRYGFNGKENDKDIVGQQDFDFRLYDKRLGRFKGIDPKESKYQNISPYNFVNNMPINAVDPNGKDMVLVIWASHDNRIGHAGIAVSNYREIISGVKKDGKWVMSSKFVKDGTYTYYDLWPDENTGSKDYAKSVPAHYGKLAVASLDDLVRKDVTGQEGATPDGVLQLTTNQSTDAETVRKLDIYQREHTQYNGLSNNCSDFAAAGVEYATGKQVKAKETAGDLSFTTPNQLYKSTVVLPKVKILKDPSTNVKPTFIEAMLPRLGTTPTGQNIP